MNNKLAAMTGSSSGRGKVATRQLVKMVNCIEDFYRSYGISAESLAHVVAFAINQPKEIDAHEILFHPTVQEL